MSVVWRMSYHFESDSPVHLMLRILLQLFLSSFLSLYCLSKQIKKFDLRQKGVEQGSGLIANKNKRDNLFQEMFFFFFVSPKSQRKIIIENVNKEIVWKTFLIFRNISFLLLRFTFYALCESESSSSSRKLNFEKWFRFTQDKKTDKEYDTIDKFNRNH